jgi:hypothetical protein
MFLNAKTYTTVTVTAVMRCDNWYVASLIEVRSIQSGMDKEYKIDKESTFFIQVSCKVTANMNVITHDDTSVTLDTGVKQTRSVKTPKLVVARLHALGIETKPPLRARKIFESVCRFYATMKRLALVLLSDQPVRHEIRFKDYTLYRVGVYRGGLLHWNDQQYTSLTAFAQQHYREVHPTRTTANGWMECRTLVQDEWVKMVDLRETYLKQ